MAGQLFQENLMTAFKSFLFFVFAPGMVAGAIPLALLQVGPKLDADFLSYLALLFWVVGVGMLIWCLGDFLIKGRGTPAPIDPPKELVVDGLYRYFRNPMYVGVLMVIFGHFLWLGYWILSIYAIIVFTAFSAFVIYYEEPHLRKTFGAAYEDYCRRVPRWLPRFK